MMIIISFIILLVIAAGLFISTFFYINDSDEWIYDENGKVEQLGFKIRDYKKLNLEEYKTYKCKLIHKRKLTKEEWWGLDSKGAAWYLTVGILSFLLALSTGISCICINSSLSQQQHALNISCEIEKLYSRETTLHLALAGDLNLEVEDSASAYHVIVDKPIEIKQAIDNYNNDVLDLKKSIYIEKISSENIWINWFINHGFKNVNIKNENDETVYIYNPNANNYRDVLGDYLKTFTLIEKE